LVLIVTYNRGETEDFVHSTIDSGTFGWETIMLQRVASYFFQHFSFDNLTLLRDTWVTITQSHNK
jgi:hypothetical protein